MTDERAYLSHQKHLTCKAVENSVPIKLPTPRGQRGFPCGTSCKEPTCQYRTHKSCRFDPWVGKIPWRRAWQPTPVFLPGKFHGQRSLRGYSPWGRKKSALLSHKHSHLSAQCSFFHYTLPFPEKTLFW